MAKLHEQAGSRCFVSGLQLPGWWPNLLEHQRELDFGVVELFGALPLAKLCGDGGSTLEYVENIIYFFVLKFLFFFFPLP